MLATASLLAQLRPADALANVGYTAQITTEITKVFVCNTSGAPASFSLYHDDAGSSYSNATALHSAEVVAANTTTVVEMQGAGAGVSINVEGTLGVQSSVANALTFSVYGVTSKITGASS